MIRPPLDLVVVISSYRKMDRLWKDYVVRGLGEVGMCAAVWKFLS